MWRYMTVAAGAARSDIEGVLDARKEVHVRVCVVSCKRGERRAVVEGVK